jgi:hypothetical protein
VIDKKTLELLYGALCKLMRFEDAGMDPSEVEERSRYRWIPIDERLPEAEELVLIQVSGRPAKHIRLYNALMMAEYDPSEGWCLEMYPEWPDAKPVAWMPLPELYGEEQDHL